MKFTGIITAAILAATAVAPATAQKRVAIREANASYTRCYNLGSDFHIEHSETAPAADGGKTVVTLVNGQSRHDITSAAIDRIVVESPSVSVTDKSGWTVLYGAHNTCGVNSWASLVDGNNASRIASPVYPGYNNSPEQGNYFWVIDLGKEYPVASVSADFLGHEGNAVYTCMPNIVNVYYSESAPATLDEEMRNTLQTTAGDQLDEAHQAAYNKMFEIDKAVDWKPLASASYPDQSPSASSLTAKADAPVTTRYIKIEVIPFQGRSGDRCFIYEIGVNRAIDFETARISDKSGWKVLYGAQNTCGATGYQQIVNNNHSDRVATPVYESYDKSPNLGNYFWVIDLGKEYPVTAVSGDFIGDNRANWNCIPKTLNVYYTSDAPQALAENDFNLLQASTDDPLDETHRAAYQAMLNADSQTSWQKLGSASYISQNSDDHPNGFGDLTITAEAPVTVRYIKLEVVPFAKGEGNNNHGWGQGDRCFLYEVEVDAVAEPETYETAAVDKNILKPLYGTPFMDWASLNNMFNGDENDQASTCLISSSVNTSADWVNKPYVVFDLGYKTWISGFSAKTKAYDVLPKEVNIYVADIEALTPPVTDEEKAKYTNSNDGDIASQECADYMKRLNNYDGTIDWQKVATIAIPEQASAYSQQWLSATLADEIANLPSGRFMKIEFVPFPEGQYQGDRIFIAEISINQVTRFNAPAE